MQLCREREDNRITWEEIKSLQQEGHDIASHTINHDDLSKVPAQTVEYEVAQSKTMSS